MKQRSRQKFGAAQITFLRKLFGLRTQGKIRNTEIREILNVEKNTVQEIEEYQSDWVKYVERIRNTGVIHQALK
jgi:hypothetical protein